jgi:hypothetical protein
VNPPPSASGRSHHTDMPYQDENMSDKMVSANILFSSTRSLLPLYRYASTMFQQNIAGKARVLGDAVGIPKSYHHHSRTIRSLTCMSSAVF